MYHYYNAITNTRGDSLPGYFVRAVNVSDNSVAPIFSDDSGTPVSVVSGVVNMALTDTDGNVSFYVASGNYHVDIYAGDQTTFIKRVPNVPMTLANVANALGTSTTTAPSQKAVSDALVAKADAAAFDGLALSSGAGSVGFSTGSTYTAGTVGAKLKAAADVTQQNSFSFSLTAPTGDTAAQTFMNGGATAYDLYSPTIPAGYYYGATIRAVADLRAGSTVQHMSAIDAYAVTRVANGTAPNEKNVVGLFSYALTAVNNSAAWAINTVCNDNLTNGAATLSGRRCIGWEADFEVNGSSIIQGAALIIQGAGTPANANAVQVSASTTTVAKWTNGFIVDDASTANGFQIGASALSGSNIAGIPCLFSYRNGSGTRHQMRLQASNAAFNVTGTENPDGMYLLTGNGNVYIGATGSSTDVNINYLPKGNGQVIIPIGNIRNFANDAAAATGGVPVGGIYRNGSVLMVRAA